MSAFDDLIPTRAPSVSSAAPPRRRRNVFDGLLTPSRSPLDIFTAFLTEAERAVALAETAPDLAGAPLSARAAEAGIGEAEYRAALRRRHMPGAIAATAAARVRSKHNPTAAHTARQQFRSAH